MKFLKINPQLSVNCDQIEYFTVTGKEGPKGVLLRVIMTGGAAHTVSRHDVFAMAEEAHAKIVDAMAEHVIILEGDGRAPVAS